VASDEMRGVDGPRFGLYNVATRKFYSLSVYISAN
jgi:hypothetical protein